MQSDHPKKNDRLLQQNSISSTFAFPKIRMKYFSCNRGADHEEEVLNYVCIKKDCDKRGLLCSMCKADHTNHITIPLKVLLSQLQKHKEKPLESSEGFQTELSQLEQIHKIMLYDLRTCVENLAQKFREIQTQINEEFGKAKIQLLQRVQMNMRFNSFIEQALNNKFENRQSFIQDIARISGMIDAKQDTKQGKEKETEIKFSANFDLVVKTFKKYQTSASENLQRIEKMVTSVNFLKYDEIKNNATTENKKDKKNKDKKILQQGKNQAIFSPVFKASTIVLQQNNRIARQTKTGQGRFVFTAIAVQTPKQKIVFKIAKLKNWIGLGIGIRQKLKTIQYRFQYNTLGHGSYLISSNGYSWSHTEQASNIAVISFKFVEADVIQLEYHKNKLIFTNKNNASVYELKLAFTEAEEKDIYFCANLCSEGDAVEILEVS